MRIIIREAAYDDLERIYAWIAKDRPSSADAVTAVILKSTDRLGRHTLDMTGVHWARMSG
jgi:plasmid stabilization system protein ParE